MNFKLLIVLIFHSTFAFQACKTCKRIPSAPIRPSEEKTEEVSNEAYEISQDSDKDINKDINKEIDKEIDKEINIVLIDTFQTSIGDFISGKEKSYFDTIIEINEEFWLDFTQEINEDYIRIKTKRLKKMEEWSGSYFLSSDIDTSLVFYPFSGPDFLHANFLYPNANEYILLALEKVGNIPDFRNLRSSSVNQYLENTNTFLRDIYLRSYFITKHMQIDIEKEKKIPGVLSSLYWFLSRTDHQIVNVERVTIDENSNISLREDNEGLDGVRFHFIKKGESKVKKLTYFSCDISDDGFEEENPELLTYLTNMRSCNTFVKSASYLMHYRSFKKIRNIILNNSITIFQDDTGIPYRYVNNEYWDIRCFGAYVKPIPDFEKNYHILFQEDLESRYKEGSEILPFSLGYHWRDASEQNQMLMIKVH